MSLVTNIAALATRIGQEFKAVYGQVGDLSTLTTTDKSDLVAAINEAITYTDNGGQALTTHIGTTTNVHGIADTAALATKTYADTAAGDAETAAKSYADGLAVNYDAAGAASSAQTAAQTYADSLAVNYDPAGSADSAEINAKSYADTAVANLIDSAPAALNTLNELAAALGDDAGYATTISTALGNRVRVDAEQTFSTIEQAQARLNIGAAADADLTSLSTAIGSTTTNYVTTFETALA